MSLWVNHFKTNFLNGADQISHIQFRLNYYQYYDKHNRTNRFIKNQPLVSELEIMANGVDSSLCVFDRTIGVRRIHIFPGVDLFVHVRITMLNVVLTMLIWLHDSTKPKEPTFTNGTEVGEQNSHVFVGFCENQNVGATTNIYGGSAKPDVRYRLTLKPSRTYADSISGRTGRVSTSLACRVHRSYRGFTDVIHRAVVLQV